VSINASSETLRMPLPGRVEGAPAASQVPSRLRSFARLGALLAIGVGIVVLLGWSLEVRALKSILPGFAVMKPNTAVGFLGAGISLWLLTHLGEGADRRLAQIFACVPMLIGTLTLFEYITGMNLGIDMILFSKAPDLLKLSPPGRMTHVAALNLSLLGWSMLLLLQRKPLLAQLLSLPVMALGLLATLGYVLGASMLYKLSVFSTMALHTACTFLLLAVAFWLTAEARCWGGWKPTK
jgi:hypothetical protein